MPSLWNQRVWVRMMIEEIPLLAWNGTITLGAVFAGGKLLMNGIYKRLDKHDEKLDGVSDRVARIEGKLEDD